MIQWITLRRLASGLLLPAVLAATPVRLDVRLAGPASCGLFDPGSDSVIARSSAEGWAQDLPLQVLEEDSLRASGWVDWPTGGVEYKFVIQQAGGGLLWEGGENRWLEVGADSLQTPPAWFDHDSTAASQLAPLQVHFRVDVQALLASGAFDSASQQIEIRGGHSLLGGWQEGPVLQEIDEGVYGRWLTFPALADCPLEYKFVVSQDGEALVWESGEDRSWVPLFEGLDQHPGPFGDGIEDEELPLACFDRVACGEEALAAPLLLGADLSFVPRQQALGVQWRHEGQARDPLQLFREQGWRVQRLRLWHTPSDPWHDLEHTVTAALSGQAAGMELLLDFHYSDTWADPGHQDTPQAWAGLSPAAMADSLRAYTASCLQAFIDAGVPPRWVQLGNEIDNGMCWPTGAVSGENDTPQQWAQLMALLEGASLGVEDAFPDPEERPQRVIHLAFGTNNPGCRQFYDQVGSAGLAWEIIGLSYYPWWHGGLSELQANMMDLPQRYERPLWLVESNYPWTLDWQDDTNNFVGTEGQLLPGYPATPEGQLAFFRSLLTLLRSIPEGRGLGLCLWEPAWLVAEGMSNPQENLALFDFAGNSLPALFLPLPEAPQLAICYTGGQLLLEWAPVAGASSYRVESREGAEMPWADAGCTASTHLLLPLAGDQCFYRVLSQLDECQP